MNIFLVLTAVSLISGVSILSGTTLYTQTSFNTAVMESNTIEDTKNNEMIVSELLSDGSIYVANQGQKNSTVVKLEIFDGITTEYSTIFGNDIPGWEGVTITEKDTTIQPLENMTLVDAGTIDATADLTGYITTSFGNKVKIINNIAYDEISNLVNNNRTGGVISENSAVSNATSVLNGFGYTANIITIEEDGRITYGYNTIGVDKSITPYSPVDSNANFAALVKDTDTKLTYAIPEFWRQYSYNNVTLTDVTVTPPNIFGYTETRITVGSTSTILSNGIIISGTGEAIFKLNNYQGQSLILRGDTGSGIIKIITSTTDLMGATYAPGLGYLIHTGATSGLSKVVGNESTSTGKYDHSWWVDTSYHRHHCKCSLHRHNGYTAYGYDATSTLVKVDNVSHKIVTGHTNGGWNFRLWDTLPSIEGIKFSGGAYETNYQFPNEQSYLYVKPNGGAVTIKAEESINVPIIKITDLPANIPYQISKDGWIGATGVTSSSGTIILSDSDVRFEGFTTKGGLLHLYPDSLTYTGSYNTIALDKINNETFHIPGLIDQVYVPAAFVKLPIPLNVEINKIKVGNVTFDYLSGNYTAGESVFVPIIPKMKTLDLTLNDVNAVINIADITNQAQSKLFSSRTDSTTLYATGSAIESIEVGVTNNAVAIATHTGTMNAIVTATVSGEAEFTINSDYTGSYEQTYDKCQATMAAYGVNNGCVQHGHPTDGLIMAALIAGQSALDGQLASHKAALEAAIIAQGPLTVTVTVFKNGEYQDTFEIFDNLNPQFTASSSLGLVSVQNAKVDYATTSGSKPITIDVMAGDYVEFIVHVGLVVSGIPSPIDRDNAKIAGFASGTVNLHHGTVTASMG